MPSFLEKQRHLPVTIAIAESCWGLLLPQARVVHQILRNPPPCVLGDMVTRLRVCQLG